ncbi:DNA-processing protein DprA [Halobacillus shinanisalinarum]|uniref:DNA-processing protein DprA n=1 Tax=Halobacillus shinanisalinarum TaxID=2932258 RepID=A0ABY4GZ93_9BACI|nr:DNA-processing protein DprA [Halobacillus shinanisalinarum]UOQ93209.1 DNA-processing protein DprA [Halobacillus shinanisalinarum]
MKTFRQRLIHLHACPQVTRSLLNKWLKQDPDLTTLLKMTPEEISTIFRVPSTNSQIIYKHIHDTSIMKKLDTEEQLYGCVTIFDKDYPELLKIIPDPPLVLYTKGNAKLLQHPLPLSVVGTRTPSNYALPAMRQILTPLIKSNFCMISGMAMGIDQYVHRLAIQYGGTTIAVIGSGFDHIYPRNNLALYKHMCDSQLIISEHPPDRPPRKYHFPERNRIISGLSEATLVIEARLRSGSLITVDQALEQGREVFAMPGPIGSKTSEGCHYMIREGATLIQGYQDIIHAYAEKLK